MRFLLDQNLPIKLIEVLVSLGHESEHVKRLGMGEASDPEIWAEALRRDAVVVSKDSDFVALVVQGGRLVRLRVGNRSNADLFAIVRSAWPSVVARLEEGEAVVEVRG